MADPRFVNFGPQGGPTVIAAADIGTGAVTTAKVADGAITSAKLDAALAASIAAALVASAALVVEGLSSTTTGANQTTGITLPATPARAGMYATAAGLEYTIGDAVKTKDFYFSRDGGTTALALNAVVSGDTLYWTKYRATTINLANTDLIRIHYDATYTAFAVASRFVIAGAGLIGGGDLSADRTINVATADGTIQVNADSIEATGVFPSTKPVTVGETVPSDGRLRLQRNATLMSILGADNVAKKVIVADTNDEVTIGPDDVAKKLYVSGILDLIGKKIASVLDPTAAQDAATKNYVDTHRELMRFAQEGAITAGQTTYLRRDGTADVTEAKVSQTIEVAASYSRIRVRLSAAPGGSETCVFTVYKNGSSTSITVTLSAAETTDTAVSAGAISFAQGDTISVAQVNSGGSAAANPNVVVS